MRREHIDCVDRRTAYRRAPWACATMAVDGGYIAFESSDDYNIAKQQG